MFDLLIAAASHLEQGPLEGEALVMQCPAWSQEDQDSAQGSDGAVKQQRASAKKRERVQPANAKRHVANSAAGHQDASHPRLERLRGEHGVVADAAGSVGGQASQDTHFAPIPTHVPDPSKDAHASPSSKHKPITARASKVVPVKAVAGAAPAAKVLLQPAPSPAAAAAQMWHAGPSNLGKPVNGTANGITHAINGTASAILNHNPPSAYLTLQQPHAADYWARTQPPHPHHRQHHADATVPPSAAPHHPAQPPCQAPHQLHLQQWPQPPHQAAHKATRTPPPPEPTHHKQQPLPPHQHSPPDASAGAGTNSTNSSTGADMLPAAAGSLPFQVVRCERLLQGEVVLIQGIMDGQLFQGCLNLIGPATSPAAAAATTSKSTEQAMASMPQQPEVQQPEPQPLHPDAVLPRTSRPAATPAAAAAVAAGGASKPCLDLRGPRNADVEPSAMLVLPPAAQRAPTAHPRRMPALPAGAAPAAVPGLPHLSMAAAPRALLPVLPGHPGFRPGHPTALSAPPPATNLPVVPAQQPATATTTTTTTITTMTNGRVQQSTGTRAATSDTQAHSGAGRTKRRRLMTGRQAGSTAAVAAAAAAVSKGLSQRSTALKDRLVLHPDHLIYSSYVQALGKQEGSRADSDMLEADTESLELPEQQGQGQGEQQEQEAQGGLSGPVQVQQQGQQPTAEEAAAGQVAGARISAQSQAAAAAAAVLADQLTDEEGEQQQSKRRKRQQADAAPAPAQQQQQQEECKAEPCDASTPAQGSHPAPEQQVVEEPRAAEATPQPQQATKPGPPQQEAAAKAQQQQAAGCSGEDEDEEDEEELIKILSQQQQYKYQQLGMAQEQQYAPPPPLPQQQQQQQSGIKAEPPSALPSRGSSSMQDSGAQYQPPMQLHATSSLPLPSQQGYVRPYHSLPSEHMASPTVSQLSSGSGARAWGYHQGPPHAEVRVPPASVPQAWRDSPRHASQQQQQPDGWLPQPPGGSYGTPRSGSVSGGGYQATPGSGGWLDQSRPGAGPLGYHSPAGGPQPLGLGMPKRYDPAPSNLGMARGPPGGSGWPEPRAEVPAYRAAPGMAAAPGGLDAGGGPGAPPGQFLSWQQQQEAWARPGALPQQHAQQMH